MQTNSHSIAPLPSQSLPQPELESVANIQSQTVVERCNRRLYSSWQTERHSAPSRRLDHRCSVSRLFLRFFSYQFGRMGPIWCISELELDTDGICVVSIFILKLQDFNFLYSLIDSVHVILAFAMSKFATDRYRSHDVVLMPDSRQGQMMVDIRPCLATSTFGAFFAISYVHPCILACNRISKCFWLLHGHQTRLPHWYHSSAFHFLPWSFLALFSQHALQWYRYRRSSTSWLHHPQANTVTSPAAGIRNSSR